MNKITLTQTHKPTDRQTHTQQLKSQSKLMIVVSTDDGFVDFAFAPKIIDWQMFALSLGLIFNLVPNLNQCVYFHIQNTTIIIG